MNTSPTLRPLLRELLGTEADGISDDMIRMVQRAVAEVKYLTAVLGEADETAAYQFCHYQLN